MRDYALVLSYSDWLASTTLYVGQKMKTEEIAILGFLVVMPFVTAILIKPDVTKLLYRLLGISLFYGAVGFLLSFPIFEISLQNINSNNLTASLYILASIFVGASIISTISVAIGMGCRIFTESLCEKNGAQPGEIVNASSAAGLSENHLND